jgi:2-keto-4-pentenoate hydratase/2-oxohepta-3-ene-1,7-dioic acid hydratase in catechol pathway
MKIARFNQDRLGLVEGDRIFDVSAALAVLPPQAWPAPIGDPLIRHLAALQVAIGPIRGSCPSLALSDVSLHSPITQPSKIMAAPANYRKHVEQDTKDAGVDQGVHRQALVGVERPSEKFGLFLKSLSSLAGPAEGIRTVLPDRRTDHEVELAVVIGLPGRDIPRAQAMRHVAAYAIGLDTTVRGAEDRSFRKSPDTYCTLGPWLVTADEIPDPYGLDLALWVNEERRQFSSTGAMTMDISELIALASSFYTLHPGDVLLTGTPEGVGPIQPGQVLRASCVGIGDMTVPVLSNV